MLIHDSTRPVIGLLNLARAGREPKVTEVTFASADSNTALHRLKATAIKDAPAPRHTCSSGPGRNRSQGQQHHHGSTLPTCYENVLDSYKPIEPKRPLQDCKNSPTLRRRQHKPGKQLVETWSWSLPAQGVQEMSSEETVGLSEVETAPLLQLHTAVCTPPP